MRQRRRGSSSKSEPMVACALQVSLESPQLTSQSAENTLLALARTYRCHRDSKQTALVAELLLYGTLHQLGKDFECLPPFLGEASLLSVASYEGIYYTLLYSTILYSTLLYYTILYYTLLYSTILYSTLLYYTILSAFLDGSFFDKLPSDGHFWVHPPGPGLELYAQDPLPLKFEGGMSIRKIVGAGRYIVTC